MLYIDETTIQQTRNIFELARFVGKATDINYIELLAVPEALKHLLTTKKDYFYKIKNIYVVIDNKQAVYLLAGQFAATEPYFNKIIIETHKIANKIYAQHNITTNIQWCKGHVWRGNIEADKLANKAVDENINKTTSNSTPISISTAKNLIKTEIFKQEKKKQQETKEQHIISNILNKWNIFKEYQEINIDIQILSKLNFCVLTQLRTGHIKLNFYFHQLKHVDVYKSNINQLLRCDKNCCIENNSGLCVFCVNKIETVQHFVMECKKYEKHRNILYLETMKILYLYEYDFSLKNLLFPPPNIKNQHRKHIFDSLCTNVSNTKRLFFYCF